MINKTRYLSHYYAEMTRLKTDHPEAHEFLQNGGFSVQLGSRNPFGRIPVDQTIEETANKDTQTPGGTKGFSLNPGAVSRYYLTAEYRSSFLHLLRDAVGTSKSTKFHHPDLSISRIKRDERDVISLMELLESSWVNPFSESEDLLSIPTGIAPPDNIARDLLQAHDIGGKAYIEFREERLEADPPKKRFHDPLRKKDLKTFSDMKVKKTYQASGRQIILKADRNLFAKMILIAQTRDLDMKEVLARRLGPIPWALATPESTLRKTMKSSLSKKLRKDVSPEESIPYNSACIIDGMALVQKIDANNLTFADVSNTVLKMVLREGAASKRIDVVFDVYREQSIKDAERVNRGSATGTTFKAIAPGHKIKQWRKLLCSSDSKNKLIQFLDWSVPMQREKLSNKSLYVTAGERCTKLSLKSAVDIECLRSSQEEADTRLLFASARFSAVVIVSQDTDVFVLCVALSSRIACPIFVKGGTNTRIQYTDVHKVASMLGSDKCQALLGLHAFTGCDTVSAFAGKGKLGASKLLSTSGHHLETLKLLGSDWDISPSLISRLEALTCSIYSSRTHITKVNEIRFNLFCVRKGEAESWQLPPCTSSLLNHCKRANYQCAIWKKSLEAFPQVLSPVGHGWCMEDGELHID